MNDFLERHFPGRGVDCHRRSPIGSVERTSRVCSSMAAPRGLTNRIPFSVNSVVSLSVVDVLQDHHSERFLDMIIPAYPALPQAISRVNTNTCFIQAQKCLDESTKPHSKLKGEWLALAERWIKTAEELTN